LLGPLRPKVRYDPAKPIDTAWDLGYGDMVAIWMFQAFPFEYRIIDYEEDVRRPLSYYIAELQKRGYIWGRDYLPWDGGFKSMGSGKLIEELMRAAGGKVKVARGFRSRMASVWLERSFRCALSIKKNARKDCAPVSGGA
jgi:hypothetical protein